ncbi:hypothetical protein RDI58_025975 [Solanum bulbocastanum]|uniref:Uncharacterized protein n=1 Tax=Solanum bulbocastanum TaxID=147425 RepID=A0AAN8SS65_SOLBU
MSQSILNCSEV